MSKELTLEELNQAAAELGISLADMAEMYKTAIARGGGLTGGTSSSLKERLKKRTTLADVLKQSKDTAAKGVIQAKLATLLATKLPPHQIRDELLATFKPDELPLALEITDELMAQHKATHQPSIHRSIKEQLDDIMSMLTGRPTYDLFTSKRLNQPPRKPGGFVSMYDAFTSNKLNPSNPAISAQTKEVQAHADHMYGAFTSRMLNPNLPEVKVKEIEEAAEHMYGAFTSPTLNHDPAHLARRKALQDAALDVQQIQEEKRAAGTLGGHRFARPLRP
jgi:hypothetical protein